MIRERAAAVELMRESAAFAIAEMRATHTLKTYLFGWLLRLVLQAIFFALVAGYVGTRASLRYSLVGNAVVLGCLESMIVVLMMVQERATGALPLLAASPTSHVPVYLGRGLHWLASGVLSSLTAFVVLPFALGVPLPWPRAALALPVIVVVCLTSYCYGCLLGTLALRYMGVTWLLLNLGYLPAMAFCGVNVPLSFWPAPLHALAEILPVTHGLLAVRGVLAGAPAGTVAGQLALELAVGGGWLAMASVAIGWVVRRGIATGSLEFGS
jgi:ABC-2 type transport system permease protein